MKKIEEMDWAGINVIFYDGIDIRYANEYKGDGFLIFFVDNWETEFASQKRENTINGILYDDSGSLDLSKGQQIVIYQTGGYLKETFEAVRDRMKRQYSTCNMIAKK